MPSDLAPETLDIVDGFYESIDEPSAWDQALRRTIRAFDGVMGVLYIETPGAPEKGQEFLSMPGFSAQAVTQYGAHYINVDPYAAWHRDTPSSRIFLSQEIMPPEKVQQSEIWVDFARHHLPGFHLVGAGLPVDGGRAARFAVHRPLEAEAFDLPDAKRFSTLLPHMTRALRLRAKLEQERAANGMRTAALDAMVSGVLILDRHGLLLVANTAAKALAEAGQFDLVRAHRDFRLPAHGEARKLSSLISSVVAGGAGGAMLATGRDGQSMIALSVSRLPLVLAGRFGIPMSPVEPMVLIMARDLAMAVALDPGALISIFGLTPIEAEIAMAISEGHTVEAIAEQRGRSVPTLRTQVRQILLKTGAQSTRHLIALLTRLPSVRR